MGNVSGDFIWYELMTPDADGASAFYSAVMGWTVGASSSGETDYREIQMGNDYIGGILGLTSEMTAGGAQPGWIGYIAVDDVDQSVANIVEAGGALLMPARDLPGVGRFAMVADPQGIPFYVMTSTTGETSKAHGPNPGSCSWNELATSDLTGAVTFYTGQFDWAKGDVMKMGPMGDYQFLRMGDRVLGAAMARAPGGPPPMWTYYFRVSDIELAVTRVTGGGGKILHGPQEVPGGDFIILGQDPQGAMFALTGKNT
ncbi:MAG: hypothetical protein RIS52_847 [Pseudomonadota bacterium]